MRKSERICLSVLDRWIRLRFKSCMVSCGSRCFVAFVPWNYSCSLCSRSWRHLILLHCILRSLVRVLSFPWRVTYLICSLLDESIPFRWRTVVLVIYFSSFVVLVLKIYLNRYSLRSVRLNNRRPSYLWRIRSSRVSSIFTSLYFSHLILHFYFELSLVRHYSTLIFRAQTWLGFLLFLSIETNRDSLIHLCFLFCNKWFIDHFLINRWAFVLQILTKFLLFEYFSSYSSFI